MMERINHQMDIETQYFSCPECDAQVPCRLCGCIALIGGKSWGRRRAGGVEHGGERRERKYQ